MQARDQIEIRRKSSNCRPARSGNAQDFLIDSGFPDQCLKTPETFTHKSGWSQMAGVAVGALISRNGLFA
jgi:hypothetical protein